MTTAYMTPTVRVEIKKKGKYKLEARALGGRAVLGTAECSRGDMASEKYDWLGWLVQVGGRSEEVATIKAAWELLELWAAETLGAVAR